MNTKISKKEYIFPQVQPREQLLESILKKLPQKSPYLYRVRMFTGASLAIGMLVFGGILITHTYNQSSQSTALSTLTSDSDTSDAALNQDLQAIDAQMNGLNSDTNQVDQALDSQRS